jgi:small subunit ribosomal protein S8
MKRELTRLLLAHNLILGYVEVPESPQPVLRIQLKYHNGQPVITGLKRISTPGLRTYAASKEVPRVLGGLGLAVISTSRGLMSDKQARAANVGGEVVCEIW